MEPEENYKQDIIRIYEAHSKLSTKEMASILKDTQKEPEKLVRFFQDLNRVSLYPINFHHWSNLARMLVRVVRTSKQNHLEKLLAQHFVRSGRELFSFGITKNNYKKIEPLLKITKQISIPPPEKYSHQLHTIMHLQGKYDTKWAKGLVEIINSEVLVDKKNQSGKSLKLNPYFGEFVGVHFENFQPQLERLLVRSESNIEVWVDFFECLQDIPEIEKFALVLIKKIKNSFFNHSESSIRIVNTLVSNLKNEKYFYECLDFIKGLISNEHNAKKKIVYFQMLKGFIQSVKKYNHNPKIVNQILVIIANSWVKFVEEEEAKIVLNFLETILPLITEANEEIAIACKASLKSQNKFILLFLNILLSEVYKKDNFFQDYATVREIQKTFKTQLNNTMKKVEGNWHWIVPQLNFLSAKDLTVSENLLDIKSLFKDSCLALNSFQKKNAVTLYFRYIAQLRKQSEQDEEVILKDDLCCSLCILLEEVSDQSTWNLLSELDDKLILQLIIKGLFPLLYFNCEKTEKNKGNRFISLGRYLIQCVKQKLSLLDESLEKLIIVCELVHFPSLKILSTQNLKDEEINIMNKMTDKYVHLILFDAENDENNLTTLSQRKLHKKIVDTLISISYPKLVNILLRKFLDRSYYEKQFDFINQIESEVVEAMMNHKQSFKEIQEHGIERGFLCQDKTKQKKIYLGHLLDAKMMSEAEVKQEKYRQHFDKMLLYFQKLVNLIIRNIHNKNFINQIWEQNFDNLIHIVVFPEHRMYIYKLVKSSCQITGITNKQWKIFMRYSLFFADFFSVRGAYLTPSVSLMNKCQKFFKQFLQLDFIRIEGFMLLLINDLCEYILQNMQFDMTLKKKALYFYRVAFEKQIDFKNGNRLFTYMVKNLNILSTCENIEAVLGWCLKRVNNTRFTELFFDILNFIPSTKKLILSMIKKLEDRAYKPEFEDYIKLRILSLETGNEQISSLAEEILSFDDSQSKAIVKFNMKDFIKKNSKETIEKLCQFVTESINGETCNDVYKLVLKTADELYDEGFDQEGLEFLPYFLQLNLENIPEKFLKPIFQILILKYTANEDFATLSNLSVDIGIDIIKKHAKKNGQKLLLILQSYLNKAKGVSNIVFLGVLAPYIKGNKNIQLIEHRITDLFKGDNRSQQRAIAKCMPDLMSFFKQPQKIVKNIFDNIGGLQEKLQIGQSYLAAGLLKGIGCTLTIQYLEKILHIEYSAKKPHQKAGRCWLLQAFIQNFGRVVELRVIQIIEILIQYMSDSNENIRHLSKEVVQTFVKKMSSYSVKNLLPHLLEGLEKEQNWRVKISYIWILGIMANCSAKQLQASLPIIVPTLSGCLSNAHPTIRDKAAEALSLIGETIKNPEISQSVDILIEALQNPFEKSARAIDLLLKMKFAHFIDPPSLSIIIPIVDYSLRGRISELKQGACQVIGSIVELIRNPSDILPYLKIISSGLRTAICDPLSQIRGIASMAIGKISSKIGASDSQLYFNFVLELIESLNSNTTEKSGAAQAYAEMICSQDYDYFEESLNLIFEKLNEVKHLQKEGYLLVFLYVPSIRKEEFEGFIKEVNQNMYGFVSDEDENLRNSAMQVAKVLINSYSLSHTDLLLEPLCEGVFETNWRRRNAALILIGEMLNILKSYNFHTRNSDKNYAYYKGLMAVYILKDDQLEMPRMTAHQVWNTYIENTPKTIKTGLNTLVEMWTRFTNSANGIVIRNIIGFSGKYGENYFAEIIQQFEDLSKHPLHKKGVFEVLAQFIKRLSQQFLGKENYRQILKDFFTTHIFNCSNEVRESLAKSLALYVQKMHEEEYFDELIYPEVDKMAKLNEESQEYIDRLHLMKDLLHTSSHRVVNRLINKIMEHPLSEFKIEVITNNADKVANNLYTLFLKKPATQTMLSEILSLIDEGENLNRLSLLVYCLNQISVRLENKFKNEYMKMMIENVRNAHKFKNPMKIVEKLFEMILFFLNSISLGEIESLEQLIGVVSPFIFKGTKLISENAHKIFLILISDPKGPQTGLYYRQLIVSLENNKGNQEIWKEEEVIKDYVSTLVKGIAYGNTNIMEDSLSMLQFMINTSKKSVIQHQITRIVGPVIRVANYPLHHKQKQKLLQFLQKIYQSEHNVQIFNHQVISVCLRLLSENKGSKKVDEIITLVSSTLFSLIQKSERKGQIILNLLHKIKIYGEGLVRTLYQLTKTIIKEKPGLLPKPILEQAHQQFHALLAHNEFRLPIPALYYLSKMAARIGSFLNIPIQMYEEQIEGLTCSYQTMMHYLHHAYYTETAVPKLKRLELFIQESGRQKVFYLLKSIKLCRKRNARTMELYTHEYLTKLVPQTISGFDDIVDIMQELE